MKECCKSLSFHLCFLCIVIRGKKENYPAHRLKKFRFLFAKHNNVYKAHFLKEFILCMEIRENNGLKVAL